MTATTTVSYPPTSGGPSIPSQGAATSREPDGWIVSPAYDLLFLANLAWPLLLLPAISSRNETVVDFWQVYFLTLPHRWVTLILVLADPDRREGNGLKLALMAAAATVLVAGVWLGTEALTCLAVVDYLWNAWHFAAQNGGVLRMYSRKVGGGPALLERHGVRLFVTYAVLRTAGWTTGRLEADPSTLGALRIFDLAMLAVPAALVATTLFGLRRAARGKAAYVLSLSLLYSGLIVALSYQEAAWVVGLVTASSLFHATEYLAVVTAYARRRRSVGSDGIFRAMARHWLLCLGAYMTLLGAMGVRLDRAGGLGYELWQGLNLWAALVHYAFDGVIWKLRKPATARALGIDAGGLPS